MINIKGINKVCLFILSIIILLIILSIFYLNNCKNDNVNIYNSLVTFNNKNYNNKENKHFKILNIEKINRKNVIVISTKSNYIICSILHKNLFKGWKVSSSTVNGFISKNEIVYTSSPKYKIGMMIGSIDYSNKIKSIKINNIDSKIIKHNNILVFYSKIIINSYIKPEVSILYKDGTTIKTYGWYINFTDNKIS